MQQWGQAPLPRLRSQAFHGYWPQEVTLWSSHFQSSKSCNQEVEHLRLAAAGFSGDAPTLVIGGTGCLPLGLCTPLNRGARPRPAAAEASPPPVPA